MKNILEFVLSLAVAALLFVVLIEWAAGCGETYVDAAGARHQYKCVFINN